MARTLKDARQIGLRKFLTQIGNRTHHEGTADAKPANQSELDNLLDSIDLDLTPPLRLDASNPADLTISVGPAIVTNTETNRKKTIPHIGSLLPDDFTAGTIVFSTPGGAVTITPGNNNTLPAMGANEYVKVLMYMDANGDLNILSGVPNAVEGDATVLPPPRNTLPIGYVTLQADGAGTALNTIDQAEIFQFGTGAGGGGGAGDANSFTETLKNRLCDSIFEAVTPYVAEENQDDADLVDATSTGEFDLVSNRFKLDTGETLLSANLLDPPFLAAPQTIEKAELILKYDEAGLDESATYEMSVDGGVNWETLTMERIDNSFTYRGIQEFTRPDFGSNTTLSSATDKSSGFTLNATSDQAVAGEFAQGSPFETHFLVINIQAVNGSPVGRLTPKLVKDDGGLPSTDPLDVVFEATSIDISTLSAADLQIELPITPAVGGTYHIVLETDSEYKTEFTNSAGANSIAIGFENTGSALASFDGTTWSAGTGVLYHFLYGSLYNLLIRVTGSADDKLIEGFGVLYEQTLGDVSFATTTEGITKAVFQAVADNSNEFVLPFLPNPDLLVVHLLGSGQSFRFGDFGLDGNKVIFAEDQFNNNGEEKTQTLIFDQIRGGAFDNSDANAALMAANGLGALDGSIDKSGSGGIGIKLRGEDGILYEIKVLAGGIGIDISEAT